MSSLWEAVAELLEQGERPIITLTASQKAPTMRGQPGNRRPRLPRGERWKKYAKNLLLGGAKRPRCLNCLVYVQRDQLVCSDYCRTQATARYTIVVRLLRENRQDALSVIEEMVQAGLHVRPLGDKPLEKRRTLTVSQPESAHRILPSLFKPVERKKRRKTIVDAIRDGDEPLFEPQGAPSCAKTSSFFSPVASTARSPSGPPRSATTPATSTCSPSPTVSGTSGSFRPPTR